VRLLGIQKTIKSFIMKKLIYIFFITCLAIGFGCASEDDSSEEETEQVNPDDLDGDGVTNQQEVVDNTGPNNPCDYRSGSQYFPSISNSWKSLDCDGDGVSNWKELDPDGDNIVQNNRTDTLNGCSLNLEDVDLEPSEEWLLSNCDTDPFSNGQELADGTDIFDNCDFIIGNQDLQPFNSWLEADCDSDSRTNGREIEDNTDPLDPSDFDGAGSILKEIYLGTKNNYSEKHTFIDGILYDKIEKADGTVITDFDYDSQNRLTSVFIEGYDNDDATYTYTYNNNQISQITRTQGTEVYIQDLEYEGNIIYIYDGSEFPGLYAQKFTFNNQNALIAREQFFSNGTRNDLETYEYDDSFENLLSSQIIRRGHNTETGEFYELMYGNGFYNGSKQYGYNQDAINLFYDAYQNMRLLIILSSVNINYITIFRDTFFPTLGSISTKFLDYNDFYYETDSGTLSHSFGYGINNLQSNNLPSSIYTADFDHISYEVHYE